MSGPVGPHAGPGARARVMICDEFGDHSRRDRPHAGGGSGIQVVAKVSNGRMAIDELKRTKVDVLVLDIEMPVMDGMTALPLLLQADPGLKVIMASTLTTRGADIAMRALRMGAADYVPKPSTIGATSDEAFRREMVEKVKGLARLRRRAGRRGASAPRGRLASAAGRRCAAETTRGRQFHWRAAGVVHSGAGSGQNAQRAGRADAAHAGDIHARSSLSTSASWADCRVPRRRMASVLSAGRIYLAPGDRHLLIGTARGGVCERGVAPIRRRIFAGRRWTRCCAAPPPRATAAYWWRC